MLNRSSCEELPYSFLRFAVGNATVKSFVW